MSPGAQAHGARDDLDGRPRGRGTRRSKLQTHLRGLPATKRRSFGHLLPDGRGDNQRFLASATVTGPVRATQIALGRVNPGGPGAAQRASGETVRTPVSTVSVSAGAWAESSGPAGSE